MNPILVHYLNCRRAWPFPVRCLLYSAGAILLLAAGSVGLADDVGKCNAGNCLPFTD